MEEHWPSSHAGAAPVSTFVRGGARRAKAERRAKLLSSMMQVAPTDESDANQVPPPILALGLQLEQVMLALDREDAQNFRTTCKAARIVTLTPGFAVLWRKAHPEEAKAKQELARLRTYFSQLDEVPLETEVCSSQHEITWERILPPRRKSKVSGQSSAASSS